MVVPNILCIGSVLWDIIGRTSREMTVGSDVPGRITRVPGGVALNIAMTLARLGEAPALLSVVGRDGDGDLLVSACAALGMNVDYLFRSADLPTDRYMAIEAAGGLMAAMADAHSLEAAGDAILRPLGDGRLGRAEVPFSGMIALDGNLTTELLAEIAASPLFAAADLRVAPASPGKAARVLAVSAHPGATLYVNLHEACSLLDQPMADAASAAQALVARGGHRVLVTHGGAPMAEAGPHGVLTARPPAVTVTRVTGAGDALMAAHMAAELDGLAPHAALDQALGVAAEYVSGGTV